MRDVDLESFARSAPTHIHTTVTNKSI
eukprot:SAG11_NODE_32552_length_284_cov_1.770492_1_plen_26_part_10